MKYLHRSLLVLTVVCVLFSLFTVYGLAADEKDDGTVTAADDFLTMTVKPQKDSFAKKEIVTFDFQLKCGNSFLQPLTVKTTLPDGFVATEDWSADMDLNCIGIRSKINKVISVKNAADCPDTTSAPADAEPGEKSGGCGSVIASSALAALICGAAVCAFAFGKNAKKKIGMLLLLAMVIPMALSIPSFGSPTAADYVPAEERTAPEGTLSAEIPFTYDGASYTMKLEVSYSGYVYGHPTHSTYTAPEYTKVDNADFYVSTTGSDENDGSFDHPFATLEKAKEAVRELKKTKTEGGITVAVMAGSYPFPELKLGAEDSGTEACPITYCKYGDGDVFFDGGYTISLESFTDLTEEDKALFFPENVDKIKRLELSTVGIDAQNMGRLFNATCMMNLSRYPNTDEFGNDIYSDGLGRYINEPGSWSFRAAQGVFERFDRYHTFEGVRLSGYLHRSWDHVDTHFTGYDPQTKIFTINPAGAGVETAYWFTQEYYFYNISEELDSSNEYFLDREKGILYLYDPQDPFYFVSEDNRAVFNIDASYTNIVGFTMRNGTGTAMGVAGDHNTVDQCVMYNFGSGISMDGTNNTLKRSEIYSTTSTATFLSGGNFQEMIPANNVFDNVAIHNYAQVDKSYHPGIRLWGFGLTVSHCEIYNAPHMGIHYGGCELTVEYNYFHNLCQQNSDAGAVYAGRTWNMYGDAFRYNLFCDIGNYKYKANAVYFDDGLSGQAAYGNIMYNIYGKAVIMGGGPALEVRDNIMINTGGVQFDQRYYDILDENDRGKTGDENFYEFLSFVQTSDGCMWQTIGPDTDTASELWKEKYPILALYDRDPANWKSDNSPVSPIQCIFENNVEVGNFTSNSVSKRGKECAARPFENNNVYAMTDNPGFADPANGDYSIAPGTRLESFFTESIKSIPLGQFGRY